jgi:hypothetical protein
MLVGQVFVMLLMYYLLKNKLKEVGKDTDKVYAAEQNGGSKFAEFMEHFFDTAIQKLLANQDILDQEDFTKYAPKWYSILHNFKKVNRHIT